MPYEDDDNFEFYEKVEKSGISPWQASFTINGGRYVGPWITKTPVEQMPTVLWSKITLIMGDCQPNGSGGLARTLPVSVPLMPWLTAVAIQSLVGFGVPSLISFDNADLFECQPLENAFAAYPNHRFVVEYQQKPYAILRDETLTTKVISWYLDDDSGVDDPLKAEVPIEWKRFTNTTWAPMDEVASAEQGQMVFRTNDASAPNGFSCHGFPKMQVPKAILEVTWYFVPYSYIESRNSYLTKYIGRINQNAFEDYLPGELLYMGFKVGPKYPPPVPEMVALFESAGFSTRKLVDVTMTFFFTQRDAGAEPPTPENRSFVAAGWNLLPFLGSPGTTSPTVASVARGFYYATLADSPSADPDPSVQFPNLLSGPIPDLLFYDPDAPL